MGFFTKLFTFLSGLVAYINNNRLIELGEKRKQEDVSETTRKAELEAEQKMENVIKHNNSLTRDELIAELQDDKYN